jgi:hypothetical protein
MPGVVLPLSFWTYQAASMAAGSVVPTSRTRTFRPLMVTPLGSDSNRSQMYAKSPAGISIGVATVPGSVPSGG